MGSPYVSVILPTYNRAHTLLRSIESVLNQTYSNFELIIVDDGSTDNTTEVVKSFNDSRIIYIKKSKNAGPASARNTGINNSRGKYIAFQDSDDEWLKEKLEKQILLLEKSDNNVGVVYSSFYKIMSNNNKVLIPKSSIKEKEGWIYKRLLSGNIVGMPVALIKKECFEKCGNFNENLHALEDWELFLRISKDYKFIFINEALVISYESPVSVSKNRINHINAIKTILKENYNEINKNNKLLSQYCYLIGKRLLDINNFEEGKKWLNQSLKSDCLNLKALVARILSMLGSNIYGQIRDFYVDLKARRHNLFFRE